MRHALTCRLCHEEPPDGDLLAKCDAVYLLDTNVVSELRKPRPHGAVVAWITAARDEDLHISAVSLGEIQAGIELTRQHDAAKATELDLWADLVSASYNVVPMDGGIFRRWAQLMHGQPDSLYEDAMIAATALDRRYSVVTRNVRDFVGFGVTLIDPFG